MAFRDALIGALTSTTMAEVAEIGRKYPAEAHAGEALAMLKRLQWGNLGWCPICCRKSAYGHTGNCALAALIAKMELP